MRFVTPDVERIPLKDGPDGEKNWIEVKRELTAGEKQRYRTAGLSRMHAAAGAGNDTAIDVDWERMALARVEAYLVDWSAKDAKGKDVKVSASAIRALSEDDFREIDEAIEAHVARMDEAKKTQGGSKS